MEMKRFQEAGIVLSLSSRLIAFSRANIRDPEAIHFILTEAARAASAASLPGDICQLWRSCALLGGYSASFHRRCLAKNKAERHQSKPESLKAPLKTHKYVYIYTRYHIIIYMYI